MTKQENKSFEDKFKEIEEEFGDIKEDDLSRALERFKIVMIEINDTYAEELRRMRVRYRIAAWTLRITCIILFIIMCIIIYQG